MNWKEERRRDRAAEAEQRRADLRAQTDIELAKAAAMADARRAAERERRTQRREEDRRRQAAREARRTRRRQALAGLRAWATTHVVDLLIYPLALVSALMAVPAMAGYGHDTYGTWTGYALPVISELGMWAFAVAVQVTRHRHPDRPVWALQLGVWLFAGVAMALNVVHGLGRGLDAGVVMGAAAVAGVVAHQLVVASPRRSRAERADARIARQAARKVAQVRRAAVRQAVAEIDDQGRARLVYTPGRYTLDGRLRRRLIEAIDPDQPSPIDDLDRELADLIEAEQSTRLDAGDGLDSGSVATLDREAAQGESSTPHGVDQTPTAHQKSSGNTERRRGRFGGRPSRSMDQLRAELHQLVRSGEVDPTSAESIRRGLRCAKGAARELRDEYSRRS